MRPRHKVPSVFSLSMVDVLCCALGCVILIWLLNSKISEDEAEERREETAGLLEQARQTKERSDVLLAAALKDTKDLDGRYQLILADRDKAAALARLLKDRSDGLEKDRKGLTLDLQRSKMEVLDLTGKLKTTDQKASSLEGDLLAARKKYDAEQLRVVALDRRLVDLLAKIKTTEGDLDATRKLSKEEMAKAEKVKEALELKAKDLLALQQLLEEARTARKLMEDSLGKKDADLLLAKEKRLDLEKLLDLRKEAIDEASRKLTKAERDKAALRLAVENRFAGIELAGRRVIFLIDMSGSMKFLAESKPAPDKWREVRETVARLMRSMTGLEKYQVITFAGSPAYPLEGKRRWLEYDKTRSPDAAFAALAAIDPRGGTNMYDALEEAFTFRADGLDTVFVLSDGLPNQGKGTPAGDPGKMSELDRGMALGKFVLKTLKDDWNAPRGGARVKVHTVGFFYESPDLGAFLWALARENDGSFVGMSRP
ncbi:MAG: VWA domain-containing protein [Gemmataceae bacterium]